MVPMLTCGLVRSNFALPTGSSSGLWCRDCRTMRGAVRPPADVRSYGSVGWSFFDRPVGLLAPGLLDDLVGNVPRNLGVAVELHRVHRTTLGLGPQVADVPEHLGKGDLRTDDLHARRVLHGLDHAAARVDVADDVTHVLLRSTDLDGHDRLEENRVGLADRFFEDHRARDLERHLRG